MAGLEFFTLARFHVFTRAKRRLGQPEVERVVDVDGVFAALHDCPAIIAEKRLAIRTASDRIEERAARYDGDGAIVIEEGLQFLPAVSAVRTILVHPVLDKAVQPVGMVAADGGDGADRRCAGGLQVRDAAIDGTGSP